MKLRKLWGMMGAAIATSILLIAPLGNGILAKGNSQGKGNSLAITADAVFGALGAPSPELICVESNHYSPGDEIVWRVVVRDENGNPMDDTELRSVVVNLPGNHLDAIYYPGGHPVTFNGQDHFWTAVWTIPNVYRVTGSLPYQVAATANNGSKGRFNDAGSILILSPPL